MKNNKKNVIFIILDSLRFDRIGFCGHNPSPSPAIDKLLSRSLFFTNAFSAGCPTEFAYPGLTSSTLPLDKGGYAMGIRDRDVTLAEVFRNAGYKTGVFFEDHFRSPTGYSRGFDDVFLLFDLVRFLADVGDTIPYYLNRYQSGRKSTEDCIYALEEYLNILFHDMITYCRFMQESLKNKKVLPSLLLHYYNFTELEEILINAEKQFHSNPEQYILALLNKEKPSVFEEIRAIVETRKKSSNTSEVNKKLRKLLFNNLKSSVRLALTGKVHRSVVLYCMRRLLRGQSLCQFASAAYIINNLFNWIDRLPGHQPFFAWIHTADIHELNITSYDVPNNANMMEGEVSAIKKLYSEIVMQKDTYYGNPLYDFAIRYTDLQIERFIKMLKDRNLLDDTLIVLTSDHGHLSVGWPLRRNIHIARDFYDELYHVPIAFISKDISPQKMEGLYSSLDIAPTLLKLLEIPIPSGFRGKPVDGDSDTGRDYIIMEHLGPGTGAGYRSIIECCKKQSFNWLDYQTTPNSSARYT